MNPRALFVELIQIVGSSKAKALITSAFGDMSKLWMRDRIDEQIWFDLLAKAKKVAEGEPLEYVTKRREFMGLSFHIETGVFIPRHETEELVEYAMDMINEEEIFLDIGTGSGVIAISLSYYRGVRGYAVDISHKSIEVAKKNAEEHGVLERITFIEADVFSIPWVFKEVDFIVANPPYIPRSFLKKLPRDVQREPTEALNGGEDGLDFYRKLFADSLDFIRGKKVLLEFAPYERTSLEQLLVSRGVRWYRFIRDLAGVERFVEVLV